MKKIYTTVLVLCSFISFGTHNLLGGIITWENRGPNAFVFKLEILSNCYPSTAHYWGNRIIDSPFGPITMYRQGEDGFSSTCYNPGVVCSDPQALGPVARQVYKSHPMILSGTPPASGWKFSFLYNPTNLMNIFVPIIEKAEIFSIMYPEPVAQNRSSPEFVQNYEESITPFNQTITNQAYSNHGGDSLFYKLVAPITEFGIPYVFIPGYSHTSPFPTAAIDTLNGPMKINPHSGDIKVDVKVGPDGYYGYTIAVEQWRFIHNGQKVLPVKVSMVRKDFVIPLSLGDSSNSAPNVFIDTAMFKTVNLGNSGLYKINPEIGDTVRFQMQASDLDLDSNIMVQTIAFDLSGAALDSNWGGWRGASLVPKLTPASGQAGFVSQGVNNINFEWYISPDLWDSVGHNYYQFKFSFTDNHCTFMGRSNISVAIRVKDPKATSGVSISEVYKTDLEIYPNPANESFKIEGLTGKSQIQVLDVQGKLVQTYSSTDSKLEIERNNLPSGIYFVKVTDSNTTSLEKVMFD